jgi:hypothetical protein
MCRIHIPVEQRMFTSISRLPLRRIDLTNRHQTYVSARHMSSANQNEYPFSQRPMILQLSHV